MGQPSSLPIFLKRSLIRDVSYYHYLLVLHSTSAIMVNRSTGQECCWPQHISSLNGQRRANNCIYPHVGREQRYPKMKQLALQLGKGYLWCSPAWSHCSGDADLPGGQSLFQTVS